MTERLDKLEQLKASGALTEDEYKSQRHKILESYPGYEDDRVEHAEPSAVRNQDMVEEDEQSRKSIFSTIGLVLFLVGLGTVFYAGWIYDPSVSSSPDIGGDTVQEILDSYERAKEIGETRINNTGLLNRQLIIALLGVAVMICGAVMYAASKVIDAIQRR